VGSVYPVMSAEIGKVLASEERDIAITVFRFWREMGYAVGGAISVPILGRTSISTCVIIIGFLLISTAILLFLTYSQDLFYLKFCKSKQVSKQVSEQVTGLSSPKSHVDVAVELGEADRNDHHNDQKDQNNDNNKSKKKVLFLCTGNSCRSHIAEAIVNARLGDSWEAVSAGTKPAGYVHPKAIAALAEIGITHNGTSKNADQFRGVDFNVVVSVCDDAADNCPDWLAPGKRVHMPFDDPAKAEGSDEEIMAVFRRVRDEIAATIPDRLRSVD